jgi:amino-acid N-acetyltransferase
MISYTLAESFDLDAITNLLNVNKLPYSDIEKINIDFIVAKNDNRIVGCIGLEKFGTEGMLRSFAVEDAFKNKGIGIELYHRLLSYAHQNTIRNLHLLTNTAREYFLKTGFLVIDRNKAPEVIKRTTEFSGLCPVSSTYMVLENISAHAVLYGSNTLKWQTDAETNSSYWAVKGNNVMFTHFTVPAKGKFNTHSHASEQITHVISGVLIFEINDKKFKVIQGDTIHIPSNAPHSVYSEIGATAVDAWAPVNEVY